jgi:methyl-accepting chemotaxis protein
MKRLTLNRKLGSMIVVLWIGLALIGIVGGWQHRVQMLSDRQAQLMAVMDQALSIAEDYYAMAQQQALNADDARKQALAAISKLRYGDAGYFTALNSEGIVEMHPIVPTSVGTNHMQDVDRAGNHMIRDMLAAGDKGDRGGFTRYIWQKPGSDTPVEKMTLVRRFKPWDLYFTTGMYIDDIDQALVHAAVRWFAMIAALGALATVAMSLVLRSVRRDLGGEIEVAIDTARRMAHGDLTARVLVRDGDRASLMHALAAMQTGLAGAVLRVRAGAENIDVGAGEIAAGNADLSQRTEQQAAALVETASSMDQMTANVKQNADSAVQAAQLAEQAANVATHGSRVIGDVVRTMDEITSSSKKIADITGVIDGIAFQTNILALNAAVEAARAGEQGRGFAVVAAEVRSLAQRSAAAAKEIKALIETSTQTVDQGAVLVATAGTTMGEIMDSVRRVNGLLSEISHASQEQSTGIEQVNRAVGEMDQVTQQNAALVEEAAAAAQSLKDQVSVLRDAIAGFALP